MSPLPPILPAPPTYQLITPEPLTPSSFSPFGTAITSPLPASQSTIPKTCPRSPIQQKKPAGSSSIYQPPPHPVVANQSTALKYAPISPLANNYPNASRPQMSMFSCFPRALTGGGSSSSSDGSSKRRRFAVKILERHPFTTQTFCPLGLQASTSEEAESGIGGVGSKSNHTGETCFLVVVAPSLSQPATATSSSSSSSSPTSSAGSSSGPSSIQIQHPPDLSKIKAFIAHGGQAVTYGPGTWHAPMVVLGKSRIDFVVTQFVSGVPDEDCQEVLVGGDTGGNDDDEEERGVAVDLDRQEMMTRSKL